MATTSGHSLERLCRLGLIVAIAGAAVAQDEATILRRARERQQQGDLPGALAVLDAAIRPDSSGPALWMTRAAMRFSALSFEGALEDCNRGLALLVPEQGVTIVVGDDPSVRNMVSAGLGLRGHVRSRLCDWPGAAKDLADATKLAPGNATLWRARAAAEQNAGRTEDAVQSLGSAIELGGAGAADLLVLRSQAQQLTGRLAAAREDLDRASELTAGKPQQVMVDLERVVLAAMARDARAARVACERVRGANPALAGWVALMCWSLALPAEREAAATRLRADFAAMPTDDPLLAELLALSIDGVGDADGFTLVGRESDAQCPLWYFGGSRSALLGRDAEARTRFLRCVNSGRPDYAQWRLALARLRATAGDRPLQPGLGLVVEPVRDAAVPTLRITKLVGDGAGATQGLGQGDEIRSINGQPATLEAFTGMTAWLTFGSPVRFEIVRGGASTTKSVVAGVEP